MPAARTDTAAARRALATRVAGLYAVTPDIDDAARLLRDVTAALDGGAAVVQYRNKTAQPAQRRAQARALARLCAARGALFIVNDDAGIAADVEADGVHLGADDGDLATARARIGPERLIGVSCYADVERAARAASAGADYVAFGSFFASGTKPLARHAGVELLQRARTLGIPVVAIGGITAANAQTLIDAGADAVAVIAGVFAHADAADVARAASAIAARFRNPAPSGRVAAAEKIR